MVTRLGLLWLFLIALPGWSHQAGSAEPLHVAVASSFAPALKSLAAQITRDTGITLLITTGSSGSLYQQLSAGAPQDLFLSADERRPRLLCQQIRCAVAPQVYARGILVWWQPGQAKPVVGQLAAGATLAIAKARLAPYGRAAAEVLRRFDSRRWRLARGNNIAQTFQFVASGNADAGLVALSYLIHGSHYQRVPPEWYKPIEQFSAIPLGPRQSSALRVLNYLHTPAVQQHLQQLGFEPLKIPAHAQR